MSRKPNLAGRAPSQRQLRVGETVRHALAELLSRGELRDPAVEGKVITVTEVTVTPDLRQATAYIMPLGGQDIETTLAGLGRSAKFVRGRVAKVLTTKVTPDIRFAADTSFEYSTRMDRLMDSPEFRRGLDGQDDDGDEAPPDNEER